MTYQRTRERHDRLHDICYDLDVIHVSLSNISAWTDQLGDPSEARERLIERYVHILAESAKRANGEIMEELSMGSGKEVHHG